MTRLLGQLFEHLTQDPEWLRAVLGIDEADEAISHTRASQLMLMRRYAAKIAYELELHGGGPIEGLEAHDGIAARFA